jgi:hypothetical protein
MISTVQRLFPFIFLTICSVLILGANPFAGETVAPTDILANQPGWQNLDLEVATRHPARTDILDARLPRWLHAKASIRNGKLPIWNPAPINGIPAMQWLPAAIFTPAFAVFSSINDNATGYYFALLTNLIIAATGAYLLLLCLTNNRLAATFGAIVFAYCGFHAAWFYWAQVTTSIWIPWLLWLSYQYLSTQKPIYLPWVSIVSALMIFGGFPSMAVYGFFALVIMFPLYAPWQSGVKGVSINALHLGLAILLAFFITAFATHSLHEMLQFTQTMESRGGGTPFKSHHLINFIKPLLQNYANVERTVYIGIAPLLFLIILPPLLLTRKLNISINLTFGLLLLGISISIAFGLLPKNLITAIPTFNSNNWGRMTVLTALAFALICAELISIFLKAPFSKKQPQLFASLVIALIILQFIDQLWLFRKFNGPVPAATFFAKTPTIEYIQSHLKPMQSTIADRNYMVSGIFTNYGIPEWFAHGFKSKPERTLMESKLVPNAHRSRTAAAVYCEDIYIDSNMLNLLAIKYMACHKPISKDGMSRTVLATSGPRPKASALITPEQPLIQHFALPKPLEFNIISLKLATHGRTMAHTDLTLRLYHDNTLIGESSAKAAQIQDNSWVAFPFPKKINLDVENNRLEIHALPSVQNGKISAWLYPLNAENVYIDIGGSVEHAALAAKFFRTIKLPETINHHRVENNLVLLENSMVTGSGYTLPELDENLKPDFSHLELIESTPTSYRLHYNGEQPAWLILPVRYYPGWQAYVDDKSVATEVFMEMLPAIRIDPGATVSYRYEPKLLYMLALLSLASLLFALYLIFRFRRV